MAIVCPARKVDAEELRFAVSVLESWGLRVRLGSSVGLAMHQFGGTDAERAADLQAQWADPQVKAVFCARGGYGCARLIPLLDPEIFRAHSKWLVGFSDPCALHAWLWKTAALPSIHGPMPMLFERNEPAALQHLQRLLFGERESILSAAHPLNQTGQAEGLLLGGNLSVLYSLQGTGCFPDFRGAIMFLEDLDEYLYHIDRMMLNLQLSGVLDQIAGLIIGGMTDMRDHSIPFGQSAEQIIRERMGQRRIPICFGFPAGHIADNRALILGHPVRLQVEAQGARLSYD